jgi:glycosyltransferase involved in cell wall biosynthesis
MSAARGPVVFLLPALVLGGAERQMVRLVNGLRADGLHVAVLVLIGAPGKDMPLIGELDRGIEVHRLDYQATLRPGLWIAVRRLLERLDPDVVVGWSTYANLVAAIASRGVRRWRLVLSERNFMPQMLRRERSPWRRRVVLAAIRWLYPRADLITANSARGVTAVRRIVGPGPRYAMLSNLIDLDRLDSSTGAPAVDPIGWSGPRLLFVGRLAPQKGVDVLLDAMAEVRRHREWRLRLVGDGGQREALKALAGRLGLDDVLAWEGACIDPYPFYRWADIVVVPSLHEGFPNVLLEAMACGKAVIAADCRTGPREITEGGRHGVLVPVGDAAALARAILELGADPERFAWLGADARAHIERTYDTPVLVRRHRALLTAALPA